MKTLTHWSQVHTINPYANFPLKDYPPDLTGWHSDDPIFDQLIKEVRPVLIVEVGCWKGASTLHMANRLFFNGLHTSRLFCVDTWLGSLEFWTRRDDPERYQALKCEHGFPTVYRQFLANVLHQNREDMVIPFPNTSEIAARWFADAEFKSDLVYLDASHDYRDVMADLCEWTHNVRDGGVIFGDDWQAFPDVAMAVKDYTKEQDLPLETVGNKWVIRKP